MCVLEAMKMQNSMLAGKSGKVSRQWDLSGYSVGCQYYCRVIFQ